MSEEQYIYDTTPFFRLYKCFLLQQVFNSSLAIAAPGAFDCRGLQDGIDIVDSPTDCLATGFVLSELVQRIQRALNCHVGGATFLSAVTSSEIICSVMIAR